MSDIFYQFPAVIDDSDIIHVSGLTGVFDQQTDFRWRVNQCWLIWENHQPHPSGLFDWNRK